MGDPGSGNQWHHIVEQSQVGRRANLNAEQVNNVNNIIAVPSGSGSIHSKISGYYSSKPAFTNGLTVRDWLSTKSYDYQFEFGLNKMKEFGEVVPTSKGWEFIPE